MRALPQNFFHLIEQVPQSIIIWGKNSKCSVLFLTQKDSVISGRIKANKKISDSEKAFFAGDDSLKSLKDRLQFQLNIKKGQIKLIRFKVPENTSLNFDLKVNGIRDPRKIIFLPTGTQPSKIPFEIDSSSLNVK